MYIWVLNLGKQLEINKLRITEVKSLLSITGLTTKSELCELYKTLEPDVTQTAIDWRIHTLIRKGILERRGRGVFSLTELKTFQVEVTEEMFAIHSLLTKKFPYLKICIWDTSVLNEFMLHQPFRFSIIIDAEKDSCEAVFFFLKQNQYSVLLNPDAEIIDKYAPTEGNVLIIKSLVSEAPMQKSNEINTPSLEKILVDIFCDTNIFSAYQGSELRHIFKEANGKYSLNMNKMLRYANRRGRKSDFSEYISQL